MIRQREQVFGVEDRREFLGEYRRIFRAKSKRYDRTGVAKDCMPYLRLQLVEVLVGESQSYAELPQFRNHVRHCECGE